MLWSYFSGAKKKPILTAEQLWQFLNKEQRDPRLNEILYPHCTLPMAQEYINKYETKIGMAEKGKKKCNLHTKVFF